MTNEKQENRRKRQKEQKKKTKRTEDKRINHKKKKKHYFPLPYSLPFVSIIHVLLTTRIVSLKPAFVSVLQDVAVLYSLTVVSLNWHSCCCAISGLVFVLIVIFIRIIILLLITCFINKISNKNAIKKTLFVTQKGKDYVILDQKLDRVHNCGIRT